jgi:serine/threonine-protein kinase RIO1
MMYPTRTEECRADRRLRGGVPQILNTSSGLPGARLVHADLSENNIPTTRNHTDDIGTGGHWITRGAPRF